MVLFKTDNMLKMEKFKNKYSCSGPLAFKNGSCRVRFS